MEGKAISCDAKIDFSAKLLWLVKAVLFYLPANWTKISLVGTFHLNSGSQNKPMILKCINEGLRNYLSGC